MATTANDLKLFYSGGMQIGEFQNSSLLSLGGFRSEVIVPNSKFNNIFDEVGLYEVNNPNINTRCIFVKNTHPTDSMTNIALYIDGKSDFEKIYFGVSIPNDDELIQMLDSQFDSPYNVEMVEAYILADKVVIMPELLAGKSFALWLQRELIQVDPVVSAVSNLSLKFDWT